MRYSREREKKKTGPGTWIQNTESRKKSKKEKKLAQRNKDEETMASRKGRTREIARGLVRHPGGKRVKAARQVGGRGWSINSA